MYNLYVHVPFCRKACHYCDFHFSTTMNRKGEMVEAICKEIEMRKAEGEGEELQAIYLGGGTPSVLSERELGMIFETIHRNYRVGEKAEITIECNPEDFGRGDGHVSMEGLKGLGVNRVSIGVQSFFDEDLEFMNRAHNGVGARLAIEEAIKNFDNVTIDLIYGVPTLSQERWAENLGTAMEYGIPHISAYSLTVEEGTALSAMIKKGQVPYVKDEEAYKQFFYMKKVLEDNGYEHYELSNFGKEGFFSKNNTAYWEQKPYMGVGPSAHSYNGVERSWNISHNIKYIKAIGEGRRECEREILTDKDKYNELVMTGIRTRKGIGIQGVKQIGEVYFEHIKKEGDKLVEEGLLDKEGDFYKWNDKGLFLLDMISERMFY